MTKKQLSINALTGCVLAMPLHANITIHGSAEQYQETGGNWQTMGTNDIDGSGGLGTDGYLFFGNFNGLNTSGANGGIQDYVGGTPAGSVRIPTYVSAHGPGVDSAGGVGAIADEFTGYGSIDNPNFMDGTDTLGGFILAGGAGGVGENRELATFTVSGLVENQTVRVGILGGIEANTDGRWDSTSITLSDGIVSATVGNHSTNPLPVNPGGDNTGWVFFDIDMDGTYTVSGTKRDAGNGNQGPGISGITFDSSTTANPDSDNDGILDWWEMIKAGNLTDLTGLNAGPGPGTDTGDFDGDGLSDLEEFDLAVTNPIYPAIDPTLADSDSDNLSDEIEVNGDPATDPTDADTDDDELTDDVENNSGIYVDENMTGTNPAVADTDLDGLSDGFEVTNSAAGYDPNVDDSSSDFDGDSSTVLQELAAQTDILLADTDNDGFFDGAETDSGIFVSYDFISNTGDTGTDPLNPDTDGDGLLDGVESNAGTFLDANNTGTSPLNADSDSDTFGDGVEVGLGSDPTQAGDTPSGITVGYTATGGDWLSAFGAYDIDGDGALGTDGFVFYGDFTGNQINSQPYSHHVESSMLPLYLITHQAGADFSSAASAFANYGSIDNPLLLDGSDQLGGFVLGSNGEAGSTLEVVTFEIGQLSAGQVVRVGILGGIEQNEDGRWDPTEIFLSGPNDYLRAAIGLEPNPGGVNAGWVFFDLNASGVYSVSSTRRADVGGAGVGGLTFDSIGGNGDFLALSVKDNPNGSDLDFSWTSRDGVSYNILSSTTLDSDPLTWTPVSTGLTPAVPNASLTIERPDDLKRFYVIQEVSAP